MISITSFNDLFSSWYNRVMIGRLVSQISAGTRLRGFDDCPGLVISSASESVEAFLFIGTAALEAFMVGVATAEGKDVAIRSRKPEKQRGKMQVQDVNIDFYIRWFHVATSRNIVSEERGEAVEYVYEAAGEGGTGRQQDEPLSPARLHLVAPIRASMARLAYCTGGIRPNVTPLSAAATTPPCSMGLYAAQRDPVTLLSPANRRRPSAGGTRESHTFYPTRSTAPVSHSPVRGFYPPRPSPWSTGEAGVSGDTVGVCRAGRGREQRAINHVQMVGSVVCGGPSSH